MSKRAQSNLARRSNNPVRAGGSTDDGSLKHRAGLTPRGESLLVAGGVLFLVVFAVAWTWSIANASAAARRGDQLPDPTRMVGRALTSAAAPTAAYITDAAMEAVARRARGLSGALRASALLPEEVDNTIGRLTNIALLTLTPFSAKQRGRVGLYYIGNWPGEKSGGVRGPARAPQGRYAVPKGFIQVTRETRDTPVSEHFQLRDFLTKDQPNVWPKYLVLELRLVDKLELVLQDLRQRGVNTAGVTVMSGFRTPQYNVGGGNTGGRAGLSRHMYGDAADVYIDNDGNGVMDDLNGDGRADAGDARFMQESVDRIERRHPELIGGTGVYVACCGHGPFIHIDTRGYRARWTGSGGG